MTRKALRLGTSTRRLSARPGRWLENNLLLVAQRVDGIELRRFAGRIKTKEDSNCRAHEERAHDPLGGHQSGPTGFGGDQLRDAKTRRNAKNPADRTERDGFNQKLKEDIASACTDGHSNTDF